ncbi:ECF transporter S component [Bifidobacterium pseudolongum]|jgi:energy-coupling factor transport system substrate-specific component|uniref:ABC transporter permease n=2 Tax=Bifidobacterium pseudolongum TaxID=1694 RepID=A0A2N3QIQ1_9BIFI|nr:ECF transporter S component [Bifidobacterium pseudolongum]MBS6345468.1 ECF transporter S component [Bifidobacterium pseudolongum]MCH4856413.1 ECF transporter S component [Bifidobacterium pseudolongum]MCH4860029.1 ECF transporter S component [Bifidobacterium pseudolongum]MCH4861800.1 ECF transporter S component [Bifidobacterium pseudolongum]MCI8754270.1 ECF transporter S component [Bifidobacterium pseudolongum]
MTNTEIDAARIPYTSRRWRVVDLVTATAIAAASGLVFWMWDFICTAPLTLFGAVTPGFEGILNAFWLFAGPLAAIIIRKPGAALYAETVAAMLELLLGNQWGAGGSLVVGIMQGVGAELGFALLAYRVWNLASTMLSGALAGLGCGIYYWITNPGWGVLRASVYLATSVVSGALIAGGLSWVLYRMLMKTGALDHFASGRQ